MTTPKSLADRICVFCVHFNVREAGGYCETYAEDAVILCERGHWSMYNNNGGTDAYLKNIEKAATCADFKDRKESA